MGFGQYRQTSGCSQRSRSRYYSRKACLSPFLSPEANTRPLFRGSTSPILSMKQIYRSRMLWRFGRSLYSRWSSTISSLVGLRSQRPRLGNNGWQNSCRRAINVQLTFCHCTGGFLRPRVFLSSEMHRLAELCSGTVLVQKDSIIISGICILRSLSSQFGSLSMRTSRIIKLVSSFYQGNSSLQPIWWSMVDSCVLPIRGLGFHESNHQLPGFIGLDWTLCMVWFLREPYDSIGLCVHVHAHT